jgi:hypothetical protein
LLRSLFFLLFTALSLGLAWALRGHFGHEYGAAWAGAMGTMALLLFSRRSDWLKRLPLTALIGGIGWGVGGMMSYGLLVGYGRAGDVANAYYGLTTLLVVGALYGFMGGGFAALILETTEERKPDWATLLTQMTAGGLLFWYVLVAQFEILMTPPRSELWAACLGASVALAWYLYRSGFHRSLFVAVTTALGAGFGFGFGNFLQTMGTSTGLHFNWWNVMEFTLGFCGGLGLAYGVSRQSWPRTCTTSRRTNLLALSLLLLLLPLINMLEAFDSKEFIQMAAGALISNPEQAASLQYFWATLVVVFCTAVGLWFWRKSLPASLFFMYSVYYIVFSHLKKGIFLGVGGSQFEHYFYWLIFGMMLLIYLRAKKIEMPVTADTTAVMSWSRLAIVVAIVLSVLFMCALLSVAVHSGVPNSHTRF